MKLCPKVDITKAPFQSVDISVQIMHTPQQIECVT